MNKFLLSAIYNQIYSEIKFQTNLYNKDYIDKNDIIVLTQADYNNLNKQSKLFRKYKENLTLLDLNNTNYSIDLELLKILDECNFNKDSLTFLVNTLNPYIKYYLNEMKKLIDMVAEVMDLKLRMEGYKGEYPVYVKIDENRCIVIRSIINTNVENYLNRIDKEFKFKVTYMEFDVPLKEYKFDNVDLRDKERKEILDFLDNKVKVNLNNCKYYDTDYKVIDTSKEELPTYNKGELSLFLDKKNKTYSGIKDAIKSSFKRALFTLLVLVGISVLVVLFKYLNK